MIKIYEHEADLEADSKRLESENYKVVNVRVDTKQKLYEDATRAYWYDVFVWTVIYEKRDLA